jgi:serine/threonine protein kinase
VKALAETSKSQADETRSAPGLPPKPTAIPPTERVFTNAQHTMRAERPNASTITVGATLGKCLLTGVIGRGGRGVVYSALHTTLNIPVAVKVITADDRECAELLSELRNEAQLLARLNHPNVVRVLDFDHSGLPYVVMEMVEGLSLADLIVQTGGLRPERAADVILQAAHGLSAAWELGIVHRDIKPANLLMTRDGTVRIADLGLALTAGASDAEAGVPLGTCAYMAPEQARSAATVDFRADVYALGATFYHAVTGRLPFDAKNAREMLFKHATQTAPPAHEVAPGLVPPALSALIAKMMAKEPAARHRDYAELIGDLRAFLTGGHAPTKGAPTQVAPVARPTTIMGWLFRKKEQPEARDQ